MTIGSRHLTPQDVEVQSQLTEQLQWERDKERLRQEVQSRRESQEAIYDSVNECELFKWCVAAPIVQFAPPPPGVAALVPVMTLPVVFVPENLPMDRIPQVTLIFWLNKRQLAEQMGIHVPLDDSLARLDDI